MTISEAIQALVLALALTICGIVLPVEAGAGMIPVSASYAVADDVQEVVYEKISFKGRQGDALSIYFDIADKWER